MRRGYDDGYAAGRAEGLAAGRAAAATETAAGVGPTGNRGPVAGRRRRRPPQPPGVGARRSGGRARPGGRRPGGGHHRPGARSGGVARRRRPGPGAGAGAGAGLCAVARLHPVRRCGVGRRAGRRPLRCADADRRPRGGAGRLPSRGGRFPHRRPARRRRWTASGRRCSERTGEPRARARRPSPGRGRWRRPGPGASAGSSGSSASTSKSPASTPPSATPWSSSPPSGKVGGEVVALQGDRTVCMPFGELRGLRTGAPVWTPGHPPTIAVGPALLGRVLDGLGHPIDDSAAAGRARDRHRRRRGAPSAAAGQRRPAAAPRRAGARHPDPLRPGPAARDLRRFRRGQVVAAVDDRPGHRGPGVGAGPGRRAGPGGPGVPRARPRPRGSRPLGGRGGHLRRAGAGPPAGGVHRHPHRRMVPRPGPTTSSS